MRTLGTGQTARPATPADATSVVGLFDEAIRWFATIDNQAQWGGIPFSERPEQVERVQGWCAEPGSWVAVDQDGGVGAALVLGDAHDYVPTTTVPELYVKVLIASRRAHWRGIGRSLLALAEEEARAAAADRLRVDCYAGGTGDLVRFYESCGYLATEQFQVGRWPGQILERSLH